MWLIPEMTLDILQQLSKHPDNTWCDLDAIGWITDCNTREYS